MKEGKQREGEGREGKRKEGKESTQQTNQPHTRQEKRRASEKKQILEGNPCIAFLGVIMRFGNKVLTLTWEPKKRRLVVEPPKRVPQSNRME